MNERIREMLVQCQHESIDGPEYPRWTDLEKFAELIVQECMVIVSAQKESLCEDDSDWSDYDFGYHDAVIDANDMIKQHFGVEE